MTTVLPETAPLPSFDDRGRAVPLPAEEIRRRNSIAIATLEAIAEIGDEVEQRETLDYLKRVVDEGRLSNRPRFGS